MNFDKVRCDSLSFDPANTRKHGKKNLDAIKASLRRFGQQRPIVVDSRGIVLAGNGTLAAALELGWTEIAVVKSDLGGVDATAFGIADNRTAELAEWDQNLGDILASLEAEDFPLAEIGFTPEDLKKFEIAETEMPELSREDRAPFQQKTFTLHDNQAKLVDEAIEAAKKVGGGASLENENSNGNALAFICAEFLKGKH